MRETVRPAGTQQSTAGIRNHSYHEEIAQHHINREEGEEEEEEGEEGNGHPCDNDDDEGMLDGEGYLHTSGDIEESAAGDPNRRFQSSIIGQKKRKFEDKK